jgi:hypothetical protein
MDLPRAIEALYAAFADTPKPARIDACPCCNDQSRIDALLTVPLRSIEPNELTQYAAHTFGTVGSVDDYPYFLPRILEVAVTEVGWWPDVAMVARAISETQPRSWPVARQLALWQFLDSVFQHLISTHAWYLLDDWLCAISILDRDMAPILKQLEAHPEAMLELLQQHINYLALGRLGGGFWDRDHAGYELYLRWLKSDVVAEQAMREWNTHPFWL